MSGQQMNKTALNIFGAILVAAILVFAAAARERNRTWQNVALFWADNLAKATAETQYDPVDGTILPRFLRSRLHGNVGGDLLHAADRLHNALRSGRTPEHIDRLWTEWENAIPPEYPERDSWLAKPRNQRDPYEPAEAAFLRSLHDLPTFQVAWHNLGLIDWQRAVTWPETSEPGRFLAWRAAERFATARRIYEGNRDSFALEAVARLRLGDVEAALRAAEAAISLYRQNSGAFPAVLAVETLLEAAARLGDAERLEDALSRYPGYVPDARRRFARLADVAISLAAEGRAEEALALLDRAERDTDIVHPGARTEILKLNAANAAPETSE